MTDDVQLTIPNIKLSAYERIDGSAPPRRRRIAYLIAAVGLVCLIVAGSVYGAGKAVVGAAAEGSSVAQGLLKTVGVCPLSGTSFRSLTISGISRSYKVVIPSAPSFPSSVIVAYHGIASDVNKIEGKMKLQENSEAIKSIIVYPEARNKPGTLFDPAAFNGAGCCKDSEEFKDEDFFKAIMNDLINMGCANAKKIYVMGFSNGGFMTNRLACATNTRDYVAATCVHSGLIGDYNGVLANSPWMNCAAKPVLSIHGTSDTTVPVGGGKNPVNNGRWFSQDEVIQMWANAGGCSPPSKLTTGTKVRSDWTCGTSHNVASIKHEGFGHDWHVESTVDCMQWFNSHGRLN